MDLKILAVILLYYAVLSGFFLMGGAYISSGNFTGDSLNTSDFSEGELTAGGFLGSGLDFWRFAGLITIGVGLPDDTPAFFSTMFFIIQTCITLFLIGFIISAIWNG